MVIVVINGVCSGVCCCTVCCDANVCPTEEDATAWATIVEACPEDAAAEAVTDATEVPVAAATAAMVAPAADGTD